MKDFIAMSNGQKLWTEKWMNKKIGKMVVLAKLFERNILKQEDNIWNNCSAIIMAVT